MTIEQLQTLSLGLYIAAAVFLVLAIVLFFVFRVPQLFSDVTGRSQKRAVEAFQSQGHGTSGSLEKRPVQVRSLSAKPKAKEKKHATAKLSKTAGTTVLPQGGTTVLPQNGTTVLPGVGTAVPTAGGTTVLQSNGTTVLQSNGTTVLQSNGTTVLYSDEAGTTCVQMNPQQPTVGSPVQLPFSVEFELSFLGSEERIV